MVLDFSAAAVHIAGLVANASLQDQSGAPLTGTMTVKLELEQNRMLVIAPGLARILTLDFDLDSSTTVDAGTNTVTVAPVLVADVDLERPRVHRVRGPLESVDLAGGTFVIDLRPFRQQKTGFGSMGITVDSITHFEINGLPSDGAAGLTALGNLSPLTAVIVDGEFDPSTRIFLADEVRAGSSVPGGTLDLVHGHVMSRTGNDLELLGAEIDRSQGSVTFRSEER